jgi:hypothetical protein
MNKYEWIWEGQTQKGSCTWQTRDGDLTNGTPFSTVENDIIEKTKATYYATVVGEFVKICNEKGITATLKSVDVQCEIIKDSLQQSCYYTSRGEHYQCTNTQPFIVKVKGIVVFESPQDLATASITAILLYILTHVLWKIILAIGVAWGIYNFLTNLTLNETSSTVHVIKYDEQGNVTSDTTETIVTKQPAVTSWIGIIVIAGLVLGALVVLPSLLEKGKGKRRR